MAVSIHTPSDNINTVSKKYKLIRSEAVPIHMPSGNIDIVPINVNLCVQWLSEYIRPVSILMLSQ